MYNCTNINKCDCDGLCLLMYGSAFALLTSGCYLLCISLARKPRRVIQIEEREIFKADDEVPPLYENTEKYDNLPPY